MLTFLVLQEVEPDSLQALDSDDRVENIDDYLFLSLGISSKQNSWAGPDHWKYRKTKGMRLYLQFQTIRQVLVFV